MTEWEGLGETPTILMVAKGDLQEKYMMALVHYSWRHLAVWPVKTKKVGCKYHHWILHSKEVKKMMLELTNEELSDLLSLSSILANKIAEAKKFAEEKGGAN